jgi:ubiquinone/menaquinone biosynthesis C-methylase UbiE
MIRQDQRRYFFDYHAPGWDNGDSIIKQKRVRQVFDKFIPVIRTPVLDLGSGTGIMVPVLSERIAPDGTIIEFDLSLSMLNQASSKIKNNGNIACIHGDAHYLPFIDCQIATVICFEAFPHFDNQTSVLQELQRVLVAGGNLIILHLMGHQRLNAYHGQVGGVVVHDHLSPLAEMKKFLQYHGFHIKQAREDDDLYLIEACKSQ